MPVEFKLNLIISVRIIVVKIIRTIATITNWIVYANYCQNSIESNSKLPYSTPRSIPPLSLLFFPLG